MISEPQSIPAAKTCKCGERPVYYYITGPTTLVFHRVKCPRCGKKVARLSKCRAILAWNEYIKEGW